MILHAGGNAPVLTSEPPTPLLTYTLHTIRVCIVLQHSTHSKERICAGSYTAVRGWGGSDAGIAGEGDHGRIPRGGIGGRVLARQKGDEEGVARLHAVRCDRLGSGSSRRRQPLRRPQVGGWFGGGEQDGAVLRHLLHRLPLPAGVGRPRCEHAPTQVLHPELARQLLIEVAALQPPADLRWSPRGEPRALYALYASRERPGLLPAGVPLLGSGGTS